MLTKHTYAIQWIALLVQQEKALHGFRSRFPLASVTTLNNIVCKTVSFSSKYSARQVGQRKLQLFHSQWTLVFATVNVPLRSDQWKWVGRLKKRKVHTKKEKKNKWGCIYWITNVCYFLIFEKTGLVGRLETWRNTLWEWPRQVTCNRLQAPTSQ